MNHPQKQCLCGGSILTPTARTPPNVYKQRRLFFCAGYRFRSCVYGAYGGGWSAFAFAVTGSLRARASSARPNTGIQSPGSLLGYLRVTSLRDTQPPGTLVFYLIFYFSLLRFCKIQVAEFLSGLLKRKCKIE